LKFDRVSPYVFDLGFPPRSHFVLAHIPDLKGLHVGHGTFIPAFTEFSAYCRSLAIQRAPYYGPPSAVSNAHSWAYLAALTSMAIDRSMPVLVVDDYGTMIEVIRSQLRQLGFVDVDEAYSGAEALTKMCVRRYGLILSDWHMEPITGLDLLTAIRGDASLKQTPFIMVTGESRSENVVAAKKAGVNGYIVKPFTAQMLKAKIESVFATRAAALPERQPVRVSQSPRPGDASDAMPISDTLQLKFPGRFTSGS
jgi:two-component system, chemotaxis family, chemotaxis protein CheY